MAPIDQIPAIPGADGTATGAWAYYLRPDGSTIADTLIISGNGGIPEIDDVRMRSRYGENAAYYRERMANKGFEYIGPTLNEQGMARLVQIMATNREDEVLFCEDELVNCTESMQTSDMPELRAQARRRHAQFSRRLETLQQPLNPDSLLVELNDIARAQMLAKVDPNVMRVMRAMVGEANEKMSKLVEHFQASGPGDEANLGFRRTRDSGPGAESFTGVDKVAVEA